MPHVKTAAVARHAFLLSRFEAFPLPNSERVEWRFMGNLPRARTIQLAVNAAMLEAGAPVPDGTVVISEQTAMQLKHVLQLFVAAAPETIVAPDDPKYTEVIYSYGCKSNFTSKATSTVQDVLDYFVKVEPPSAIAGVRGSPDEVYEMMHVALRKCADSKITSAAWNAMHLIDGDARKWLVGIVSKTLTVTEYANSDEVIGAVKKALLSNDEWHGKPNRALMHCLFELFDDNDWAGLLGFCIIWPYEVAEKVAAAPVATTEVPAGAAA